MTSSASTGIKSTRTRSICGGALSACTVTRMASLTGSVQMEIPVTSKGRTYRELLYRMHREAQARQRWKKMGMPDDELIMKNRDRRRSDAASFPELLVVESRDDKKVKKSKQRRGNMSRIQIIIDSVAGADRSGAGIYVRRGYRLVPCACRFYGPGLCERSACGDSGEEACQVR